MSAVEIEVDAHHVSEGEAAYAPVESPELQPDAVVVPQGWTPQEAAQFVCSLWNIGCIIYGPQWAAHPSEAQGWDTYCAQLLDQLLPRGMGGAVELGVGLVMIGNGLAMMTMRRWPLIKRGPRPIWVREDVPQEASVAAPAPPETPAARPAQNSDGAYKLPYVPREVPVENPNGWGV